MIPEKELSSLIPYENNSVTPLRSDADKPFTESGLSDEILQSGRNAPDGRATTLNGLSDRGDIFIHDSLKAYLQKIDHPILNYDQQQVLFKLGPIGARETVPIADIIVDPETLQEREEFQTVKNMFEGKDRRRFEELVTESENLAQLLVKMNLRLPVPFVKRYIGRGLDIDDLISEGNIGLMKAVNEFDPDKPVDDTDPNGRKVLFSTFAYWWIRHSLGKAVNEQGRTIRLPAHIGDALNRARNTAFALEQEKGRKITFQEMKDELTKVHREDIAGIIAEEVTTGIRTSPISLDTPVSKETDETFGVLLPGKETVEEDVVDYDKKEKILAAFNNLSQKEQLVLKKRFGFDGRARTLEEVGVEFNVTRERIRQIEQKALKKLMKSDAAESLHALWSDEENPDFEEWKQSRQFRFPGSATRAR
jgi:RNA polymerase primary sigma factor